MSMIDYGAVVKKNGKIITDPHGGLFQNFSTFKYERDENDDVIKDESKVTYKYTYHEYDYVDDHFVRTGHVEDKEETTSLCGNYFAVIGDQELAIAFYKQWCVVALNGVIDNRDSNVSGINRTYDYIWFEGHKKAFKKDCKLLRQFKIKLMDPRSDAGVYLARFYYKGDLYEVLYGYGIDPNPKFLYGNRSYYSHSYICDRGFKKIGGYKRLLRKIKNWYNS